MYLVLIQHDQETGRYHPTFYQEHPMPGGNWMGRYKSKGHHTEGFADLDAAQANAVELASKLPIPVTVPEGGFPVREMAGVGADVVLMQDGAVA